MNPIDDVRSDLEATASESDYTAVNTLQPSPGRPLPQWGMKPTVFSGAADVCRGH